MFVLLTPQNGVLDDRLISGRVKSSLIGCPLWIGLHEKGHTAMQFLKQWPTCATYCDITIQARDVLKYLPSCCNYEMICETASEKADLAFCVVSTRYLYLQMLSRYPRRGLSY